MKIKGLVDEDFVNYKAPVMFISTYTCTFKCDRECGKAVCQNLPLTTNPIMNIADELLVERYINNPITKAVVIGGLEPFDDLEDIISFCCDLRSKTQDDIVIYTGYNQDEISEEVQLLKDKIGCNLIIKFGRFIPNQQSHYDEVLGVNLVSDNQYGVRIC